MEPSEAVLGRPRIEAGHLDGAEDLDRLDHSDAVVQPPGFTLVEEDDVAFTLQLCREVHRLYGDYQDGGLPSDDYVQAGLAVTMEMLATLSGRVTDGMPAMRITVAAAQTREMLAVMFGRDPLDGPPDGRFRARFRAIVDESARALASAPPPLPAGWAEAALGRAGRGIESGGASSGLPSVSPTAAGSATEAAEAAEATEATEATEAAEATVAMDALGVLADDGPSDGDGSPGPSRRSLLRRLFGRRTK